MQEKRKIVYIFSLIVLSIYVLANVINNTIVFADGSGICIEMLKGKDLRLYDPMRNVGLFVRQFLAWVYINVSAKPSELIVIKLLSFGYSFWTSFFYAAAVSVCYFGKESKRKNVLLVFTVALFSFHFIFVGFNLVLEAGMATAVFWFLLVSYLSYEDTKVTLVQKAIMLFALLLASRVYGSFMFLGTICIFVLLVQYRVKGIWKDKFLVTNIGLLIYDVLMCFYFVLTTENTDARSGLINTIKYIPKSFFVFFIAFTVLGLLHLYNNNGTVLCWKKNVELSNNKRNVGHKIEKSGCLLFIIVFSIAVLCSAQEYAARNFNSRSLIFLIPMCMSAMVLYIDWGRFRIKFDDLVIELVGILFSVMFSIIISTTGYSDYLKSLAMITSQQNGFIDCDQFEVQNAGYMTTWILPQESILSQAIYKKGAVAITSILVEPVEWITWEPFNSHDIYEYPDLTEYDIYYVLDAFQQEKSNE